MSIDGTTYWHSAWCVDPCDDGRFEVRQNSSEMMRLSSDGMLSVGRMSYWFATREWAEFCVARLNSLDAAFGLNPWGISFSTSGNIGIGIHSPTMKLEWRSGPEWRDSVLLSIDQQGAVKHFNLPALVAIWWRSTSAHRAWRKLIWGEKA